MVIVGLDISLLNKQKASKSINDEDLIQNQLDEALNVNAVQHSKKRNRDDTIKELKAKKALHNDESRPNGKFKPIIESERCDSFLIKSLICVNFFLIILGNPNQLKM